MRDRRRMQQCRGCGRPRGEEELFSWQGLCEDCGRARLEYALSGYGLDHARWWVRYRRGVAASVGARLIEDIDQPAGG